MMLVTVVLSILAASPQEPAAQPPRAKAFGLVLDREDEPWVGARVRLFSRPLGEQPSVGRLDLVEVESDARGRYRGQVLRGREYTVWAVAGDGSGRQTVVAEHVLAGTPVELREAGKPARPTAVTIEGLALWGDRAPLRWQATTATDNVLVESGVLGEDGTIELPPLPGSRLGLVLLDRDGRYLCNWSIACGEDKTLSLHPPRKVRARIRQAGGGGAVAGGRIWWADRYGSARRIPVADLDAEGRADFALPLAEGEHVDNWSFRITSPGRGSGIPTHGEETPATDEEAQKWEADGGVFFRSGLFAGASVRGRLVWADGTPAAGVPLVVASHARSQASENSTYQTSDPWVVTTDAEGRFTADGLNRELVVPLRLVVTADVLARLPAGWQRAVRSVGLLAVVPQAGAAHDLGEIVLDRDLWPLRFELACDDGTPAARARILVSPRGTGGQGRSALRADRLGRHCVLLPPKTTLDLSVVHRRGVLVGAVSLERTEPVGEPQSWRLRLLEPWSLPVRIVDGNGEPRAGARVYPMPSWDHAFEPAEDVAELPEISESVRVVRGELGGGRLRSLLSSVLSHSATRTDADGGATVHLPPFAGRYRVSASSRIGSQWVRDDVEVDVDPPDEDGLPEVTVVLPEPDSEKG